MEPQCKVARTAGAHPQTVAMERGPMWPLRVLLVRTHFLLTLLCDYRPPFTGEKTEAQRN